MVVTFPETPTYVEDLPDCIVTGLTSQADVKLIIDGQLKTEEIYSPTSAGVATIGMLADFCRNYLKAEFPDLEDGDSVATKQSVNLRIVVVSNGETVSKAVNVFYSRDKIGLSPVSAFLTSAGERNVCDETFYISMVQTDCNLRLSAHLTDGTVETNTLVVRENGAGKIVSNAYSKAYIKEYFEVPEGLDLMKFTAEILVDNVVKDTYQVNFVPERRFSKTLVFCNTFGAPEFITFHGSSKETLQYEADFAFIQSKYKRMNESHHKEYAINGMLDEASYRLAEEIIGSDYLYVVEGGELRPVALLGISNDYRMPKQKPGTLTLTYRYSDNPRLTIHRKDRIVGLFAETFTDVFD